MMLTPTTLIIISLVGIIICTNPLRQMPTYGRESRASIRNLHSYQK